MLDNLEEGAIIVEQTDSQLNVCYSNCAVGRILGVEVTNFNLLCSAFACPNSFQILLESHIRTKITKEVTLEIRHHRLVPCKLVPYPCDNKILVLFKATLVTGLLAIIDIISNFKGVSSALIEFHPELHV